MGYLKESLGLSEGETHQPAASKSNTWCGGKALATLSSCTSNTISATTSLCPGLAGDKTPVCGYKAATQTAKRTHNMDVTVTTDVNGMLIT